MTTTESKTSTALAMVPRSFDEAKDMASTYAQSNLLSTALRGKPADVFVTLMAGHELGLPPMASLRGIHVVEGKPVLAAATMVAIVLATGSAEYFQRVAETDDSVTYETKRRGAPAPVRCTWTMKMAQQAKLTGKDNWSKYPRAMLKARCQAELAREVYPDKLAGVYDPDEAADFQRSGPRVPDPDPTNGHGWGTGAVDGEIVDAAPAAAKPAGPTLLERVLAADGFDVLQALSPEANRLQKGSPERAAVVAAMKRRKAELEEEARVAAAADEFAGGRHDDDGDQAGAAA